MAEWDIQPLSRSHERSSFDCGNLALNEWLRKRAGQWQRKELARCYVAVRKGELSVLGYYAISSHHVGYDALPANQAKELPRIDVPVLSCEFPSEMPAVQASPASSSCEAGTIKTVTGPGGIESGTSAES